MQISNDDGWKIARNVRLCTKAAWARWAEQRFGTRDAVCRVQRALDLTQGEAKGLVYGSISQRTIDKIKAHPDFKFASLEVEATMYGMSVDEFIGTYLDHVQGRIVDERKKHELREQRAAEIGARVAKVRLGRWDDVDRRPV